MNDPWPYCKWCNGTGWVDAGMKDINGIEYHFVTPCPCTQPEIKSEDTQEDENE